MYNKIIFLDIDGVLNCQEAYAKGECKRLDDYGQAFYTPSKDLLNKLIEETGAKIVISSTWRMSGEQVMKDMWRDRKMSGEIIGITPHLKSTYPIHTDSNIKYTIPRGCEIDFYLKEVLRFRHINWDKDWQEKNIKECGIDNYIIIDDDSDMLYHQRNHFIHVLPSPRNMEGFNDYYYKQAYDTLSKTTIDLNY